MKEGDFITGAEIPCENTLLKWCGNRRVVLDYNDTTHMPSEFTCDKIAKWMEGLSKTNGIHRKSFYSFEATYYVDDYMLSLVLKSKKRIK